MFDDDMARLEFAGGTRDVPLKALGLTWPPPEVIDIAGFKLKRVSMSRITDEERAGMTRLFRGAIYRVEGAA